jgi:hypothetical protein
LKIVQFIKIIFDFVIYFIEKVPIEYENFYKNVEPANRRKILGMTTLLDESILNVTKALERKGLLKDTIIAFSSDVCLQI